MVARFFGLGEWECNWRGARVIGLRYSVLGKSHQWFDGVSDRCWCYCQWPPGSTCSISRTVRLGEYFIGGKRRKYSNKCEKMRLCQWDDCSERSYLDNASESGDERNKRCTNYVLENFPPFSLKAGRVSNQYRCWPFFSGSHSLLQIIVELALQLNMVILFVDELLERENLLIREDARVQWFQRPSSFESHFFDLLGLEVEMNFPYTTNAPVWHVQIFRQFGRALLGILFYRHLHLPNHLRRCCSTFRDRHCRVLRC